MGISAAQCHAQNDVRRLGTDRSEDRPVLVVVDHFHRFIRRRSPDRRVSRPLRPVCRLRLPVVVVVVQHQAKGLAAISAAGVGLFDGELRAMQHAQSKNLVGIVLDRTEKADAHLGYIFRFGDISSCAGVDVGMDVVQIVGLGELLERAQVCGLTRIRLNHYDPWADPADERHMRTNSCPRPVPQPRRLRRPTQGPQPASIPCASPLLLLAADFLCAEHGDGLNFDQQLGPA